ncbi:hypothetical protein ACWD7F_38345 [Streptomyces sp. NPDC005122]
MSWGNPGRALPDEAVRERYDHVWNGLTALRTAVVLLLMAR